MSDLITKQDIKKLRIANTMKRKLPVNAIDFHYNGELLVSSTDEHIFSAKLTPERVEEATIHLKKYGAGLVKFVDDHCVVHTSKKVNDHMRLLSLESSISYIRYFPGHEQEVTSMSVAGRSLISGSNDTSVRLWDLRDMPHTHRLTFPSPPLVAFHPEGNIIAIAYDSRIVEIYEVKNFAKHVDKFVFDEVKSVVWKDIKFSEEGGLLIVTTNSTSILVIDVMRGEVTHNFRDYSNPDKEHIGACFSATSNFILGGSFEGLIHVWDLKNSSRVHSLKSDMTGPCRHVAFNPKFMCIATSGNCCLDLWIEE